MEPTTEKSISQQIDEICDAFEEMRQEGNSVRIEDFLSKIEPEHREQLFEELFEIEAEMQYAAANKDEQSNSQFLERFPKDYADRFPLYAEKVYTIVRSISKERKIGDYEILTKLGHGGMGVVYKARQKHLNQVVAIKVLPQSLLHHRMAVERFRREMQLIGQLDHPNIVRALNAGELDGTQYLVMEFIDGINLQNAGEIGSPIPLGAACEIVRQAALGLQHAHEAGLVHRDIKPANLMLNFFGVVKVLDLGLGKFYAGKRDEDVQALTKTGTTMGTADYISPEQCENAENVDIRADIYSLGCTFFHIATGHAPYSDSQYDSVRKKLNAHVDADIPLLSQKLAHVPPELDAVFVKMLAKEPKDRFQTPLEVAEAIEPFADFDALLKYVDTWKKKFGIILRNSSFRLHDRRYDKRSTSRSNATIRTKMDTRAGSFSVPDKAKDWKYIFPIFFILPLLIALSLPGIRLVHNALWGQPETPQTREQRVQARINLAQLPGLNGDWWSNEIPWFIPPARYLLLQELSKDGTLHSLLGDTPEKYQDPNCAAVYDWLWDILRENKTKLPDSQWTLIETLKTISETENDHKKTKEAIEEALLRFMPKDHKRAVEQHAQAILEHRIALLEDSKELAQTAMESYRNASKLYHEEIRAAQEKNVPAANMEKENLELLSVLALSDSARLQYLASGDYNDTFRIFDSVRNSEIRKSPLFQAEMFAIYGALSAEVGQYRDELFQLALGYVKPENLGGRTHPLAGYIHERYAWSLLDQWKVNESKSQFEEALQVRNTNYRESNPYAQIYVFHNRHGIALTDRYLGHPNQENAFRNIITDIDKAIAEEQKKSTLESNETASIKRQYLASLRERAANTRERCADCIFYGGAASDTNPGKLPEAADLYEEAAELYGSAANKRVMRTKQAIMLILHGGEFLAKGEQILKDLDSEKDVNLGHLIRMKSIRQLADAVLILAKKTEAQSREPNASEQGRDALWKFLQDMAPSNPNDQSHAMNPTESARRENLEMRLFCAERLLKSYSYQLDSQQAAGDETAMLKTINEAKGGIALIAAPISTFRENQEVRFFLRRFIQQLVTFYAQSYEHTKDVNELNLITRILLPMRAPTGQHVEQLDRETSYVFFYIANRENESFVLFSPKNRQQSRLFRLPLTRAAVRQQTNIPPLDSELLELVNAEKAANHKIECSWSDTEYYFTNGLRDANWPPQWEKW